MVEKKIIPSNLRKTHRVIALVGQPNVGKSTIYNKITGELQHIGNWPGKTVEVAWSKVELEDEKIILVDLPGTYALSGFTEEEEVAIEFILHEKPDAIIVITDVSALPRNLYLLLQVLEITNRVVLVVNMMDEADRWGIKVDLSRLRSIFGIPVIGTVAIKGIGLKEMLRAALKVAERPPKPQKIRYPNIEEYIENIEKTLRDLDITNSRFMAIRIIEGDYRIMKELPESAATKIMGVLEKMKFVFKRDPRLTITSERYSIIDSIMLETFSKKTLVDNLTQKLDSIFFRRGLDVIFSFAVLFFSFFVAYQVGYFFLDLLDMILSSLVVDPVDTFLVNKMPPWVHSLVVDGLVGGIVFALTFLPLVFMFSLTLSFIENLGIFARISLAIDKFFSKFDASGKSFFPMVMGLACNVISVTSSRVVVSKKEKLRVMIVSQFIQCPPRQVVIGVLLGLVFQPLVASLIFGLYIIFGFILALFVARTLRIFEGQAREESPIELPPYRIPSIKVLSKISWNRAIVFVKRAGKWIVLANLIFWFLAGTPFGIPIEKSILGQIGMLLSIVLRPIGLGWREAIALLSGVVAKEITLGTLEFLYGDISTITASISMASLLAFVTIYAYYIPCIATMATIKSESGSWIHMLKSAFISLFIALILGYIVYGMAILIGI